MMFSFLELFKLLNVWEVVSKMIKATTEGAREFGSARVRVVVTFSAKVDSVSRLVAITFSPKLIGLGVRGSTVCVAPMSVISSTTFALTYVVNRRRIGII